MEKGGGEKAELKGLKMKRRGREEVKVVSLLLRDGAEL